VPNDDAARAFLASCGVDLKAETPIPYGNFVTKLLETDTGAKAAEPGETELGSGFDARATLSLRSRRPHPHPNPQPDATLKGLASP
jgi:hypothetical protein